MYGYVRYYKQRDHHTYDHTRCIHTVLANPSGTHSDEGFFLENGRGNVQLETHWQTKKPLQKRLKDAEIMVAHVLQAIIFSSVLLFYCLLYSVLL